MGRERRTIEVDEQGRSEVVAVHGDHAGAGSYGADLGAEDRVELSDGSVWVVEKVYSYIRTGNPGDSNFVAVDLVCEED